MGSGKERDKRIRKAGGAGESKPPTDIDSLKSLDGALGSMISGFSGVQEDVFERILRSKVGGLDSESVREKLSTLVGGSKKEQEEAFMAIVGEEAGAPTPGFLEASQRVAARWLEHGAPESKGSVGDSSFGLKPAIPTLSRDEFRSKLMTVLREKDAAAVYMPLRELIQGDSAIDRSSWLSYFLGLAKGELFPTETLDRYTGYAEEWMSELGLKIVPPGGATSIVEETPMWWATALYPDDVRDLARTLLKARGPEPVDLTSDNLEEDLTTLEERIANLKRIVGDAGEDASNGFVELLSVEGKKYREFHEMRSMFDARVEVLKEIPTMHWGQFIDLNEKPVRLDKGLLEELPRDLFLQIARSGNPVTVFDTLNRIELRKPLLEDHRKFRDLIRYSRAFKPIAKLESQQGTVASRLLTQVMKLENPSNVFAALDISELGTPLVNDSERLTSLLEYPGVFDSMVELNDYEVDGLSRRYSWGELLASNLEFIESLADPMEAESIEGVVDGIAVLAKNKDLEPVGSLLFKRVEKEDSGACVKILQECAQIKSGKQAEEYVTRFLGGGGKPAGRGRVIRDPAKHLEETKFGLEEDGASKYPLALEVFRYLVEEIRRKKRVDVIGLRDAQDVANSDLVEECMVIDPVLEEEQTGTILDQLRINRTEAKTNIGILHSFVSKGHTNAARLYVEAMCSKRYERRLDEVKTAIDEALESGFTDEDLGGLGLAGIF